MPGEEEVKSFAEVIRETREQLGWSQEDLAERAGASRPTINRYETGKTRTPDPETVRNIFIAMGLDPRRIPVLLGYVTAEEMGIPADGPRRYNATIEEVIAILEDPTVDPDRKADWVEYLRFRRQQQIDRQQQIGQVNGRRPAV